MKLNEKLNNNWKNFLIKEGRWSGTYTALGIQEGSLDIFIKHFIEGNLDVNQQRRKFIEESFGPEIDALQPGDISANYTSKYKMSDPVGPVKEALKNGHTYWWATVFGPEMADAIIEYKSLAYFVELAEKLEEIGYESLTKESFAALPEDKKSVVYEKHFMEDHLDQFFDEQISKRSVGNTGFVGNPGFGVGLMGNIHDWWMANEGFDMWKGHMKQASNDLSSSMGTH